MKITQLSISNFRSFEQTPNLEFGQINVLVGKNNAGKSSVLYAIGMLQGGLTYQPVNSNLRGRDQLSEIKIWLNYSPHVIKMKWEAGSGNSPIPVSTIGLYSIHTVQYTSRDIDGQIVMGSTDNAMKIALFKNEAPDHLLVPFLSIRQSRTINEDVKKDSIKRVEIDWSNLTARLSQVSNPSFLLIQPCEV